MRVYVTLLFSLLLSLTIHAGDDDEHEVKVVGDKNYSNNATLVYDGIDVSNYQKDINWQATAEDPSIQYVYVKATEGASHRQHRYRRNIEHARQRGIKVGSYHFLSTTSPIRQQFENFISMAKPEEQDLIPLLDVETQAGWTVKQLQDSVALFMNLLEEYYGCKPMLYTNVSYFNNKLGSYFKQYPLFIARYAKNEPQLHFGAKWILWQFSDCGVINGIDEKVDLSRFNKGCSLKDITYRSTRSKRIDRNRQNVPRPKPKREEARADVPYPANQRADNRNIERTDAQKRGEENAKKRQKMEEKLKREAEKRERERLKEQQKREKELEKQRKEQEKRERELEKKRLEQEKKMREQQEKQRKEEERQRREDEKRKSRENAQARMKAEKERAAKQQQQDKQLADQKRKDELERAKQERLAKEREAEAAASTTAKPASKPKSRKNSNQSSADNDEIKYNHNNGKK